MIPGLPLRYEMKLVCDARYQHQARKWLRVHPAGFRVAYPPRRVNSLYFDTPDLEGVRANLQGLAVRNKLRLRWYGEVWPEVQPVLELKHKDALLGTKARYVLSDRIDLSRSWEEIQATLRACLPSGGRMLLEKASEPILLNHYQREYYLSLDAAVRVTLDYNQCAYDQRLTPRPNVRAALLLADTVVIEVKAERAQADRVREVIQRFPLPRSRSSKYVNAVLNAL
jgi:hypothetical protein